MENDICPTGTAVLASRPTESIKAVLNHLANMAEEWQEGDESSIEDAETLRALVDFVSSLNFHGS